MSAFLSLLSIFLWNVMQSEAQVFVTSSNNEYENIMITCIESNCEIICDTAFGCSKTIINANLSDTLTISCLANNSCSKMNIKSGAQISTSINCKYIKSCHSSIFNVDNSQNVNLACNYDATTTSDDGTCQYVKLYADTSTNVEVTCSGDYNCNDLNIHTVNVINALNLTCDGYYQCVWTQVHCPLNNQCNIKCSADALSCSYMDIYIENINSQFNIECPASSQYECSGTEIYCGGISKTSSSELFYDGKSAWSCHVDGCCPSSFYRPSITCTAKQQCVVDCVTKDCSIYTIDGTEASSLIVNCNQTLGGGCGVTNILCPINVNAPCIIECQGYRSCLQSLVKATDSYSLQIDCKGDESCKGIDVNCPSNANNKNGGCVINCNGSDSCYYGTIEATNSYSLDLDCKGRQSCFGLSPIYCPYNRVDACNIDCSSNDYHICFGMSIRVDDDFVTDYLDFKCPTTNNNKACDNQLIQCHADGTTDKGSMRMEFDDTKSVYTCDVEPNDSYNCCPWIGIPLIPTTETDDETDEDVVNSAVDSKLSVLTHIFVLFFCFFLFE